MFLERYGLIVGALLLLVVSSCAFLLARKAARRVTQFREDQHERFTPGARP
jgi:hypothetical protein